MKRLIILIVFTLTGVFSIAAQDSDAILKRLARLIKSYRAYSVEFTITADQSSAKTISGRYVVSGEKYYLFAADREIFCDGKTKYEINKSEQEIIVDNVDAKDQSVLANPTKVFDFPETLFQHSYIGTSKHSNQECDVLTLKPKGKDMAIEYINLSISRKSGLPVSIKYKMEGVSTPVIIDIAAVNELQNADDSQFRFDRKKYKGFDLVDFR